MNTGDHVILGLTAFIVISYIMDLIVDKIKRNRYNKNRGIKYGKS